jgi:hypothetical protein
VYHKLPPTRVDFMFLTHSCGSLWDDPQHAAVKKVYLPYMYWHPHMSSFAETPMSLRAYDDDIAERPYHVCFAHSHCTHIRMGLLKALKERLGEDKVSAIGGCVGAHSGGPGVGNDNPSHRKWQKCRTVFALENSNRGCGYLTEKIMTPLLGGAIPIYGGDAPTRIAHRIFNNETFIDVNNFYPEAQRGRVWGAHEVGNGGGELEEVCTVAMSRLLACVCACVCVCACACACGCACLCVCMRVWLCLRVCACVRASRCNGL